MISIILYGRNDNYGYNLHKRAALSLNCMAEVLTDESDEIIFVDYNTPDDFPTFPEAIQDTLTRRAKNLLRILRVRPQIHQRFKSRTHLLALEPIARNIAIRRSSPSNRWILSTNTDMILVPLHQCSLSEIVSDLPDGFYHTPRIEIPEVLWEGLDRANPVDVIKTVGEWGSVLYLNEIVHGSKIIRYDGPGDFQLLLRSDLSANDGFDEEMLLGWHVDSNIAARMLLKYAEVGDLGQRVYGYHCDHTRQVTPAHGHVRVQNDSRRFVAEVTRPDVPAQAANWGCLNDTIEEIKLSTNPSSAYVKALRETIGPAMSGPIVAQYSDDSYNKVDYDTRHLLPFLTDMFVSMPRTNNVAWYGIRSDTLRLFANIWNKLNFIGLIFVTDSSANDDVQANSVNHVSPQYAIENAHAFVFDFGGLPLPISAATNDPSSNLRRDFRRAIRAERHRLSQGLVSRRIIALNAIGNEYEHVVCSDVAAAATPFATHMRHGFVLPPIVGIQEWLPLLAIGEAGSREGKQIKSDPDKRGCIVYGPYRFLEKGTYLLRVQIEPTVKESGQLRNAPCVLVEVRMGPAVLALHPLKHTDLQQVEHTVPFLVSEELADGIDGLETRILALRPTAINIRTLTIEPSSMAIMPKFGIPAALRIPNWLPFLDTDSRVHADANGIIVGKGDPGFAVWGPYWQLPLGYYDLVLSVIPIAAGEGAKAEIIIDVATDIGQTQLTSLQWCFGEFGKPLKQTKLRLPFTLSEERPTTSRTIETRIFTDGKGSFRVRSLEVRARANDLRRSWLRSLVAGGLVQFRGSRFRELFAKGRKLRFRLHAIKSPKRE